jgi:DtxR family Mn-dependent transcriptional regulator
MPELTQGFEDYLKTIYALSAEAGRATTSRIAERLGIRPASVTGMLQRMAGNDPPLIEYHRHHGAALTVEGRRAALEVIRHHRLLEAYLVHRLGYSWDAVHEEACRLEHVISEDLEQRISSSLGDPVRDPHGDPIPSAELIMPATHEMPLSQLREDARAVVRRVDGGDAALLRHLEDLGLVPGAQLSVRAYSPYDGNLTVCVRRREARVLGTAVTDNVFVEAC